MIRCRLRSSRMVSGTQSSRFEFVRVSSWPEIELSEDRMMKKLNRGGFVSSRLQSTANHEQPLYPFQTQSRTCFSSIADPG